MVTPLDPIQRDVVCTILQDCVDQLEILGGIIPNYADKPSALDAVRRRWLASPHFVFAVAGDGRRVEAYSGGPASA